MRELLYGVAVGVLTLTICLSVAELLVRAVAPQQVIQFRPDIWQPVDTLGWTFRPGVSARINAGDGWADIFTDERGFRVGRTGAVEADRNILLLGDSFMAAIQVDFEESVAGLMERDLRERLGEPVAVWNAAVPGWDPPHYLLRARTVMDAHADIIDLIVVGIFLGNDIVGWRSEAFDAREPAPEPRFRVPRRMARGEWIDALARPMDDVIRQRSHLYVLMRHELTTLRMRLGLTTAYFPREYLVEEAASRRWDNTAEILADIAAMAADVCVPTLFFLIPPRFQADPSELARHAMAFGVDLTGVEIDQPNQLLGERMKKRGLRFLDPTPALRATVQQGQQPYGSVDAHFSAEGHAVTWSFIQAEVTELLQSTNSCVGSQQG